MSSSIKASSSSEESSFDEESFSEDYNDSHDPVSTDYRTYTDISRDVDEYGVGGGSAYDASSLSDSVSGNDEDLVRISPSAEINNTTRQEWSDEEDSSSFSADSSIISADTDDIESERENVSSSNPLPMQNSPSSNHSSNLSDSASITKDGDLSSDSNSLPRGSNEATFDLEPLTFSKVGNATTSAPTDELLPSLHPISISDSVVDSDDESYSSAFTEESTHEALQPIEETKPLIETPGNIQKPAAQNDIENETERVLSFQETDLNQQEKNATRLDTRLVAVENLLAQVQAESKTESQRMVGFPKIEDIRPERTGMRAGTRLSAVEDLLSHVRALDNNYAVPNTQRVRQNTLDSLYREAAQEGIGKGSDSSKKLSERNPAWLDAVFSGSEQKANLNFEYASNTSHSEEFDLKESLVSSLDDNFATLNVSLRSMPNSEENTKTLESITALNESLRELIVDPKIDEKTKEGILFTSIKVINDVAEDVEIDNGMHMQDKTVTSYRMVNNQTEKVKEQIAKAKQAQGQDLDDEEESFESSLSSRLVSSHSDRSNSISDELRTHTSIKSFQEDSSSVEDSDSDVSSSDSTHARKAPMRAGEKIKYTRLSDDSESESSTEPDSSMSNVPKPVRSKEISLSHESLFESFATKDESEWEEPSKDVLQIPTAPEQYTEDSDSSDEDSSDSDVPNSNDGLDGTLSDESRSESSTESGSSMSKNARPILLKESFESATTKDETEWEEPRAPEQYSQDSDSSDKSRSSEYESDWDEETHHSNDSSGDGESRLDEYSSIEESLISDGSMSEGSKNDHQQDESFDDSFSSSYLENIADSSSQETDHSEESWLSEDVSTSVSKSKSPSPGNIDRVQKEGVFHIGDKVVLHSLKKAVELNGELGHIVSELDENGRHQVVLEEAGVDASVKPINLNHWNASQQKSEQLSVISHAMEKSKKSKQGGKQEKEKKKSRKTKNIQKEEGIFHVGDEVILHSLKNAAELNDEYGKVVSELDKNGRHQVVLDKAGIDASVKPLNMKHIRSESHNINAKKKTKTKKKKEKKKDQKKMEKEGEKTKNTHKEVDIFHIGDQVLLVGLEKAADFNGECGQVISELDENGRHQVVLEGTGVDASIKPINLKHMYAIKQKNQKKQKKRPEVSSAMPLPDDAPISNEIEENKEEGVFHTGDIVILHGLKNAAELNGERGQVVSELDHNGRHRVILEEALLEEDGVDASVKPMNLKHAHLANKGKSSKIAMPVSKLSASESPSNERIEMKEDSVFHIGDRVVLQGLTKAASLNGQRGRIVSELDGNGRHQIILDEAGVDASVKPMNLIHDENIKYDSKTKAVGRVKTKKREKDNKSNESNKSISSETKSRTPIRDKREIKGDPSRTMELKKKKRDLEAYNASVSKQIGPKKNVGKDKETKKESDSPVNQPKRSSSKNDEIGKGGNLEKKGSNSVSVIDNKLVDSLRSDAFLMEAIELELMELVHGQVQAKPPRQDGAKSKFSDIKQDIEEVISSEEEKEETNKQIPFDLHSIEEFKEKETRTLPIDPPGIEDPSWKQKFSFYAGRK